MSNSVKKKNTLYRNFRAKLLRLEHRQMWDLPVWQLSSTEHKCLHCGTSYVGSYCPKCAMPARWQRFTWKLLILNFLDIWGLGNRPMFRTIRDLYWRPGYMMRDYLRGHHLSYFPPFKLLALLTVLLIFISWLLNYLWGINIVLGEKRLFADHLDSIDFKELISIKSNPKEIIGYIRLAEEFLNNHILYRILIQNAILVFVVWFIMRHIGKLNVVETFFTQIYINSQFLIVGIIALLLTHEFSLGIFFPYAVPDSLLLLTPLLLTWDFHQLYGLSWKSALWRVILVIFAMAILYCAFAALLVVSVTLDIPNAVCFIGMFGIMVVLLLFFTDYIHSHRTYFNTFIIICFYVLLTPMLLGSTLVYISSLSDTKSTLTALAANAIYLGVIAIIFGVAVFVHKRFQHSWVTLLTLLLLLGLIGDIIYLK